MDTRVAGNGEWRTVEKNKQFALPSNYFIGRKNTLVYWRIQGNEVVKTQWMMHEFRISTIFHPIKVMDTIAITITIKNIDFFLE
jgi:hypothetical protein